MLPNKRKFNKKTVFKFWRFWAFFGKKTAKTDQKWRKLAKSKPFGEIFWNLVWRCYPTKKCKKKLYFDFGLCWPFFNQKTSKIDQKWRKLAKSKPFDEIFWNLVCRCFPTKKIYKHFFLGFWSFFGRFLTKKQRKKKKKKIAKIQTIWWNFLKFGIQMLPNKKKCYKKTFFEFWPFLAFL